MVVKDNQIIIMEQNSTIDEPIVDNPIAEGERRLPGFSRYAMNYSGIIRNIMTGTIIQIDAEKKKFRLHDDTGARKWFFPTPEYLENLFAPPAPVETTEDKYTKEIIPNECPIIEPEKAKFTGGAEICGPHVDANGNNIGEHQHHKPKAKNSKKDLSDQDIRDLRAGIENKSLTFKSASEKYGIHLEHARRIYKRQYYPNVV